MVQVMCLTSVYMHTRALHGSKQMNCEDVVLRCLPTETWGRFPFMRIELLVQSKRRRGGEGIRCCLHLSSFWPPARKVKLCLMELAPGKEQRSWCYLLLCQWLPSSELALLFGGSRAGRRWLPNASALLPGLFSAFGAWSSAS